MPFGVISSFPPPPRPLRDAYVDAFWGPFDMRNRVRGKDLVWSDLVWSGVLIFAKFCLEKNGDQNHLKNLYRDKVEFKSFFGPSRANGEMNAGVYEWFAITND